MAGEITASVAWAVNKGNLSRSAGLNATADMTGTLVHGPVSLATTTTYASISKGSIGTPRYVWIRNLHATVVAKVSVDNGATDFLELAPASGVPALLPLDGTITITNIKIKSVTNPGEVEYAVIEA